MADFRLLIGGERVDGAHGTYSIVNPATEEVVGQAPEGSVEQARQAADAAAAAFPGLEPHQAGAPRRAAQPCRRPAATSAWTNSSRWCRPRPAPPSGSPPPCRCPPASSGFAATPRVPSSPPPSRCRRRRCPPPPWPPAASSAPRSCASRWAWRRASRRTTSRSSTWPARSAPPSPWATRSSSSRPPRTRSPSPCSVEILTTPASRRASSTSSSAAAPRSARPS